MRHDSAPRTSGAWRAALLAMLASGAAGCATTAPRPAVAAAAAASPTDDRAERPPTFPPIPRATGPLALRVVYPPDGATIVARDSTFIFGSVGTGDARLTINGLDVPVLPNGAWLGWLPLPADRATWSLVATRGADTLRLTRRLVLAPVRPVLGEDGPLRVDSSSVRPVAGEERLAGERIALRVRAPRNATVTWIAADGRRRALHHLATLGLASGDPSLWGSDVEVEALQQPGRLLVARGRDTVVLATPRVAAADSAGPRYGVVGERAPAATSAAPDSDRVISARPVASGGTYKWFLLPGTVVELTGRSGDMRRARLDRDLEVWLPASEVRELPAGAPAPVRVAGNARVVSRGEWSDFVIPMADRPAYALEEHDEGFVLDLFGTTGNTDILNLASADSIVRQVTWSQPGRDRVRYVIATHVPPYGYVVRWERGAFVLRMRRAPLVRPERPLAGLVIAVDAGHPPGGSTGPTGLYEAAATLPISERLKALLEARGAQVFMTRTGAAAVPLGDRPEMARRAGAHAFVSIHLNALPDGVNPFTAHGTGTYYFNARAVPLARAVQRGMVRRMGLRDLGINYDNLAVLRPTWMPSILCEGAFVMLPEQEALLRTPEFQQAYALGVAEGLETYFRALRR
jgi:N-acetylmuramoyl-L-alanine amidase